eukprot:362641-Chlamydomonas_euryale.AAC.1
MAEATQSRPSSFFSNYQKSQLRSMTFYDPQKGVSRGQAPADCPQMHVPGGASRDPSMVPPTTPIPNASCNYSILVTLERCTRAVCAAATIMTLPSHAALQVLGYDKLCSNNTQRLRGQTQSELEAMRRAGWIVVPLSVPVWRNALHSFTASSDSPDSGSGGDVTVNVGQMIEFLDSLTGKAVEASEAKHAAKSRGNGDSGA